MKKFTVSQPGGGLNNLFYSNLKKVIKYTEKDISMSDFCVFF